MKCVAEIVPTGMKFKSFLIKNILVVFVYLFISTYFKSDVVFFFKLGKQERHRNKILLINVL